MEKYGLVKQVIALLEQFEEENPANEAQNLTDFAAWLNQTILSTKGHKNQADVVLSQHETVDSVLGKMIAFLYRYARSYSKKGLEGSPLVTTDDFTYLAVLNARGSMTKMELIDYHIQEKTTGIEIIKRLLKNGLVEQQEDKADKRSKRLTLTQNGRNILFAAFPPMGNVATLVAGNLSESEKMQMLYLMNKLHLFHQPIYKECRELPVEEIIACKLMQPEISQGQSGRTS